MRNSIALKWHLISQSPCWWDEADMPRAAQPLVHVWGCVKEPFWCRFLIPVVADLGVCTLSKSLPDIMKCQIKSSLAPQPPRPSCLAVEAGAWSVLWDWTVRFLGEFYFQAETECWVWFWTSLTRRAQGAYQKGSLDPICNLGSKAWHLNKLLGWFLATLVYQNHCSSF